jgi:acyl dehydratase
VKSGETLPALERTLDLASLVGYAAATWDWYRVHYDPGAVAAARLPRPLVDGQMLGALLAEHALSWAPEDSEIKRMGFRFSAMVFAGDTVRVEGEVEAVDETTVRLTQRVLVGDKEAVTSAWIELLLI